MGADLLTPKEYFNQAFELDEEVISKQKERNVIRETVLGATRPKHSPSFSNQFHSTTEDLVMKLSKREEEINEAIDKLVDFKTRVGTEIDQLEDRRFRIILRERYIRCKSWADIAIEQNYDKRYIYELHGYALKEFEKEFPAKFI